MTSPTTASVRSQQVLYCTTVWSTRAELVVTDPGRLVAATAILHRELDAVDRVANRFQPGSELNVLHRATWSGGEAAVSPELGFAIAIALRAAELTDGAVDPTVGAAVNRLGYDRDIAELARGVPGTLPAPGPVAGWRSVRLDTLRSVVGLPEGTLLDLGATAKAWAADRAAQAIAEELGCGVMVSVGGDLAVQRAPEGGFAVGIADVCGDTTTTVHVSVSSGGIATSGVGSRHWMLGGDLVHHLVDPATGLPVSRQWRTVSVGAGTCVDANAGSTAAMVKGAGAPTWLEEHRLPARLVAEDGTVTTVAGWPTDAPVVR